jgi:hypothetical protein
MNQIISELENISVNVVKTFGKLSSGQINFKPSAKSWSIGQCFEHLIITNSLYFPAIQKVIDGKHTNNFFSKIPFSTNLISALMKNSLSPDQKRKMKTFKIFEPVASNIRHTIIDDFAVNQRQLIEMVKAVQGMDIHNIKIAEPLSVALNLRLDDAFEILMLHEQRHFNQAMQVFKVGGFPQ